MHNDANVSKCITTELKWLETAEQTIMEWNQFFGNHALHWAKQSCSRKSMCVYFRKTVSRKLATFVESVALHVEISQRKLGYFVKKFKQNLPHDRDSCHRLSRDHWSLNTEKDNIAHIKATSLKTNCEQQLLFSYSNTAQIQTSVRREHANMTW